MIEHLLAPETTDRAMQSVSHQVNAVKFLVYSDLAGFDISFSETDQPLVKQLATLSFVVAPG